MYKYSEEMEPEDIYKNFAILKIIKKFSLNNKKYIIILM